MNKKDLKKQYFSHCENTAPDMDKLWEKIESGLEEKPESGVTSKPVRTVNFRKMAILCTACAAVLIAVPSAIIGMNSYKGFDGMTADNAAAGIYGTYDGGYKESNDEAAPAEEFLAEAALPERVYYEELRFATPVSSETPLLSPTAEPFGDDFFVEEKVLAETDIIVDAVVRDVFYSSGGDTVVYELSGAEDSEHNYLGNITVESATPYVLKMSREYILPLKETEDGYSLVFENAPQIECTLDGGVIFHNGWRSLDENSCWVSYPRNTVDDFFYDRMRFSYTDVMTALADKWKDVKNNTKEE